MMLRNIFLLFIVIVFDLVACNQPNTTSYKPNSDLLNNKKKSQGKIEFTKEMHNFGTLKAGETVSYSFQFRNLGESSFRLTKVEPACGCLSVQYEQDEIAGLEFSYINVVFHSDGEWGNQIKTISIGTSNGETKTLTIGAFVENENFNIDLNK